MRAVDTNVVLRLIVADDEDQAREAQTLLQNEVLHVSLTVLIEVEWVLRSAYGWKRERIADVLAVLTDLDGLVVDEAAMVRWAAERLAHGADFADMIHLVATRHISCFVTFDRGLARRAGVDAPLPVETLGVS
ncbi:type II toxin-antitoxin system VapC family toxin [Sphingomonas arantia]|uniref:Type II toxin-antitoxin system VapC family toxin n=1 Tax=Sphingomonas arantia TaxID=1460676 RepID=A0ABW4U016_9SPHN